MVSIIYIKYPLTLFMQRNYTFCTINGINYKSILTNIIPRNVTEPIDRTWFNIYIDRRWLYLIAEEIEKVSFVLYKMY